MFTIRVRISNTHVQTFVRDNYKEMLELALMYSEKYGTYVVNELTGEVIFDTYEDGNLYINSDVRDYIFRSI